MAQSQNSRCTFGFPPRAKGLGRVAGHHPEAAAELVDAPRMDRFLVTALNVLTLN